MELYTDTRSDTEQHKRRQIADSKDDSKIYVGEGEDEKSFHGVLARVRVEPC